MKAEKTTELLRKSIDEGIRFITQGAGSNHALNIIKQLETYNSRNPGKLTGFYGSKYMLGSHGGRCGCCTPFGSTKKVA